MKKEYESGAWSERDGNKLTIGKGDLQKVYQFQAEDIIYPSPLPPAYAAGIRKAGKNPDDYCCAGDAILAKQFIPEIEACIVAAKEMREAKKVAEKALLEKAIMNGSAFRTVEIASQWGAELCWARRFTESEKCKYSEWYKNHGMVGFCGDEKIKIEERAVHLVIGDRSPDGSFLGCENSAWIITEKEWEEIIDLSHGIKVERDKDRKEFEKEEAADLENKEKTGYCFNCESWCDGGCGNYQPSPDYKFRRDLKQSQVEENYGIKEG